MEDGKVPKFRNFLVQLAKDLKGENLESLKFLYEEDLGESELEKVDNGVQLMQLLLRRGIIANGDLSQLIDNLKDIQRQDLAKRCQIFQNIANKKRPKIEHAVSEPDPDKSLSPAVLSPRIAAVSPLKYSKPPQADDETELLKVGNSSCKDSNEIAVQFPSMKSTLADKVAHAHNDVGNATLQNRSSPIRPSTTKSSPSVPPGFSARPQGPYQMTASRTPAAVYSETAARSLRTTVPLQTNIGSGASTAARVLMQSSAVCGNLPSNVEADGASSMFSNLSLHGPETMPENDTRSKQFMTNSRRAEELFNKEGLTTMTTNNSAEFPMDVEMSSDIQADGPMAVVEPIPNSLVGGIQSIVQRVEQRQSRREGSRSMQGSSRSFQHNAVNSQPSHIGQQPAVRERSSIQPDVRERTYVQPRPDVREQSSIQQQQRSQESNVQRYKLFPERGTETYVKQLWSDGNPTSRTEQTHITAVSNEGRGSVASNNLELTATAHNPREPVVDFITNHLPHADTPGEEHQSPINDQHNQLRGSARRIPSESEDRPHHVASLREAQPLRPDDLPIRPVGKHLRNYQQELADEGLAGKNCIICAPTGSGKTMTAGYICKERRKGEPRFKTLFIVCIRNLVNQQFSALSELFPDEPQAVAAIGETDKLQNMINDHDIVVLTAQILVNSLRSGEVNISSIDLLIMDECHHTNLDHAYNNIMRHIHDVSYYENERPLPQIVGLTASLGVGKDDDNPLEHYITMCANLNCKVIASVKDPKNMAELIHYNPKPSEDQIRKVNPRSSNVFSKTIMSLMRSIERETRFIGGDSCQPKGSQGYTAWVVQEQKKAESVGEARETIDSCEALNVLNTALEHYDDLRAVDVLDLLHDYFDRKSLADDPLPHKEKIFQMYYDVVEKLTDFTEMEEAEDQPKLGALQDLLLELFSARSEEEPKVILLTRTIFSTVVLQKFVGESDMIKGCGANAGRLVGKGTKKYCMTDEQQESVLRKFRGDELNLLIATDVAQEGLDIPKCNLLIRYNFVSNEIGSVQAKGRARAQKSKCYLILNRGSVNERREIANLQREHKMMDALKQIDKLPKHELHRKIEVKKDQLFQKHLADEERKKKRGNQVDCEDVTIVCRNCKAVFGSGTDVVRKGESQFINTHPDMSDRIQVARFPKERQFRHDSQQGVIRCCVESCQSTLGTLMAYKEGQRRNGYTMSIKSVMFQIRNNEESYDPNTYTSFKQWKAVPFFSNITKEDLCQ